MKLTTDQMMGSSMPPEDFARWYVADIMKSEFSAFVRDLGEEACRRQTRMGQRYASHFGINRPDQQGQFLTIMWAIGPNFFETDEFAHVLARSDLSEVAKVDALYKVSDEAGGRATQRADDRYWFPWLIEGNILGLTDDPEWDDDDLDPDEGWDS